MTGLTPLGTLHTAISLVAVVTGLIACFRYQEISPRTSLGKIYLWTTVVTCITGFGIFQHGGFGPPHVLGVLTLIVLVVTTLADKTTRFGRLSPYVVTVGYSLTLFFHMVPAAAETFTRLPTTSPLFTSTEDPAFKTTTALFFLVFLVGATLQVRRLLAQGRRSHGRLAGRA